jgi:hypothetical protein
VRRVAAAAAVGVAITAASTAGADSFTPVVLNVSIAPVARLHRPLRIRVAVTADAGVLDTASAPLRIRVKLAPECGGEFSGTPGVVLLDKRLKPQPAAGVAYSGVASGSGKPNRYGVETVCVFLEEEEDDRQFATDTSDQVNVSRPCTVDAGRYDADRRVLKRALKHKHSVAQARRKASAERRVARRACGSGVPL